MHTLTRGPAVRPPRRLSRSAQIELLAIALVLSAKHARFGHIQKLGSNDRETDVISSTFNALHRGVERPLERNGDAPIAEDMRI